MDSNTLLDGDLFPNALGLVSPILLGCKLGENIAYYEFVQQTLALLFLDLQLFSHFCRL